MQLFIREAGQTLAVSADPNAEVLSLKEQVATAWGIPAEEQRLIFAGKSLDASATLSACGLTDESTVFVNLELAGGGKKRKKKTYTKPKKIKHKRKKAGLPSLETCSNTEHQKSSVRLSENSVNACIGMSEMSFACESVQGR